MPVPAGSRHWRQRRPASMLGAAMLGLHEVIYGPHREEIVIVVDADGEPPDDDLPEVHLDPDHPERSEVIVQWRSRARPRPRRRPGRLSNGAFAAALR